MSEAPHSCPMFCARAPQGARWLLTFAALSLLGCGDAKAVDAAKGVTLEADATPAALESMLSLKAEDWEWSAGFVRTPSDGTQVPSQTPVTFTWTTDLVHEDKDAATEPAFTGVAFLLEFSTPTRNSLARVFTSLNEYTPSDEVWQSFVTSGEAITLHVNAADFSANQIVKNGGPFSGLGATFTVVGDGTP